MCELGRPNCGSNPETMTVVQQLRQERDVIRARRSLSCFYGITHAPFMCWLLHTQQWARERVSGWDLFIYFKRMKRRVYVISVKLFIFCMMNNGQVLTHALKGRVEAVADEFPERLWLHKTALFFHSSTPRRHRSWWDLKKGVRLKFGTKIDSLPCEFWTCHTHARLLDLLSD